MYEDSVMVLGIRETQGKYELLTSRKDKWKKMCEAQLK